MLVHTLHTLFSAYTFLLLAKVIGSWFPRLAQYRLMHFVGFYTDPYLNVFRRVIPPIGGVLDLSPLFGFIALELAEKILMRFIT